ncbi:hypothetical protein [Solibaculum intestinale]|uniref:Uncharacterized protein n=1 Tax=Solibaculum intestinale TaxID=3133165 RepID=A0ABV1DZA7_9FIRM
MPPNFMPFFSLKPPFLWFVSFGGAKEMNTLSGGNRTDKADGGKAENGFFAKPGIRKAGKSQGCSFSLKLTFRMIFRMPLSFAPPKERGERKEHEIR